MKIANKHVGAGALAAILIATSFGASGSGAIAQDQAEPEVLETVDNEIAESLEGSEPAIRFVMNEVVQDVPEESAEEAPQASDAASLRELVSTIDTDGELSRDMMCLAQAVYFESRGEPLDGQLAVATVVINRAESALFPDDYCSVVTQRAQFSFVRGGRIPTPNHGSAAWDRAKAIARIAHRDLWESEAEDSLYFHATYVRPRWAGRMTARATINRHIFYR
ncbi:cell wall hydrolase [Aurantiacibacter sp. MUD11]|uniref:cell wall hydrolase n=1 Tax=Aurantiacibacter sp. MUD11 TaxID=3003265 RepID=UPI0022AA59F8|nr:cell wall hydrolase [Aurantiacibacter sp. MUD11]WAT17182.1 cell wall hydrolase [Aurantiacibacter sp. MUD11]